MLVAYFWPLGIIFVLGLGALVVVAFPGVVPNQVSQTAPPVAEQAAPTPLTEEPAEAALSLGNTSLWVDSEPVGADVYVDGESVGTTPILVPVIDFGNRRVSVRAAGFEPSDTVMLIDSDAPAELYVTLDRQE